MALKARIAFGGPQEVSSSSNSSKRSPARGHGTPFYAETSPDLISPRSKKLTVHVNSCVTELLRRESPAWGGMMEFQRVLKKILTNLE